MKFKNYTDDSFTESWGGNEITIKAGEIVLMEDAIAKHFAKHLADRELNRQGLGIASDKRNDIYSQCLLPDFYGEIEEAKEVVETPEVKEEIVEETKEVEVEEKPKVKRVKKTTKK